MAAYKDLPPPLGPFLHPDLTVSQFYHVDEALAKCFDRLRSWLISFDLVRHHLRALEQNVAETPAVGPRPDIDERILFDALESALEDFERAYGFRNPIVLQSMHLANGQIVTTLSRAEFENVVAQRHPFVDLGTDRMHGDLSHRLQWFIICGAFKETPFELPTWCCGDVVALYSAAGSATYTRQYKRNVLDAAYEKSLWSDLFDLGPTRTVDARSPAWLTQNLLYGELAKTCPVISACVTDRYARRGPINSIRLEGAG